MNFLESLVAQWYGWRGYFVRSNVRVRPLKHGGYGAELDVLAYSPKDGQFFHVETSSDALAWPERERRMKKKFDISHKEYEKAFSLKVNKIRKFAICGPSKSSGGKRWGEIEVITVREFVRTISEELSHKDFMREAVPESYPLLRAIQATVWAMNLTKVPRLAPQTVGEKQ